MRNVDADYKYKDWPLPSLTEILPFESFIYPPPIQTQRSPLRPDGILGFSQGAAATALLLSSLSGLSEEDCPRPKFAIMVRICKRYTTCVLQRLPPYFAHCFYQSCMSPSSLSHSYIFTTVDLRYKGCLDRAMQHIPRLLTPIFSLLVLVML